MALQTPNPTADLTMATVPSPVVLPADPSSDGAEQLAASSTAAGNGPSKRTSSCGNLADSGNFTFDVSHLLIPTLRVYVLLTLPSFKTSSS